METIMAEVAFPFEGGRYVMVFDWGAIEFFEAETGLSFGEFLIQLTLAEAGAGPLPLLTRLATFIRAGLRRHHPDMAPDLAFRMWSDPKVRQALTGAADKAFAKGGASGEPVPAAAKSSTRAKRGAASVRRGSRRAKG